jgi:hypothetical protein
MQGGTYCPISSDEDWRNLIRTLPVFGREAWLHPEESLQREFADKDFAGRVNRLNDEVTPLPSWGAAPHIKDTCQSRIAKGQKSRFSPSKSARFCSVFC